MATVEFTVYADTRLARAWVRLAYLAHWLIGAERAYRWAKAGALRLTFYRIGERGRWRRLRLED